LNHIYAIFFPKKAFQCFAVLIAFQPDGDCSSLVRIVQSVAAMVLPGRLNG